MNELDIFRQVLLVDRIAHAYNGQNEPQAGTVEVAKQCDNDAFRAAPGESGDEK